MAELWLGMAVGVISGCALVLTAAVWMAARDLRQTLRRLNRLLASSQAVSRQASRALHHVEQICGRASQTTRQVDTVIRKVCEGASDLFEQAASWRQRVQTFWVRQVGNGAGLGPRRKMQRGGSAKRRDGNGTDTSA